MTGSISRKLYQQFLGLYPEPFRHEFGDEMLSIFEECRVAQGSWRLLVEVLLSGRQATDSVCFNSCAEDCDRLSQRASSLSEYADTHHRSIVSDLGDATR